MSIVPKSASATDPILQHFIDEVKGQDAEVVRGHLSNRLAAIGMTVNVANGHSELEATDNPRLLIARTNYTTCAQHRMLPGQIVQIIDGQVVVISAMAPAPNPICDRTRPILRRNMRNYEAILVDDGTNIGFYWFGGRWVIRTYNGYDVGSYAWNTDNTYNSVLADVLSAYPTFRLEALDTNKCYTIGIKNTKFHPFLEGRPGPIVRAWFIAAIDLARVNAQGGSFAGAVDRNVDIGLPHQEVLRFESTQRPDAALAKWPLTVEYAEERGNNALGRFIATGSIYYGVIFRPMGGANGESYIAYSDLYRFISDRFYTKKIQWAMSEGTSRQDYLALYALLHPNREFHIAFLEVFPQFRPVAQRLDAVIENELLPRIVALCGRRPSPLSVRPVAMATAQTFADMWAKRSAPGQSAPPRIGGARELVMRSDNAGIMYDLVYAQPPPTCIALECVESKSTPRQREDPSSP